MASAPLEELRVVTLSLTLDEAALLVVTILPIYFLLATLFSCLSRCCSGGQTSKAAQPATPRGLAPPSPLLADEAATPSSRQSFESEMARLHKRLDTTDAKLDAVLHAEVQNAATDGISCVSWSPAANYLAAGSWDNQIRCWEVQANGTAVPKAAISHDAPVLCCAWANDGARVFTGSCDKTAKVWDLATSQATQVAGHDAPIKNIFWVQEMNCVVTSSWDKTIKYWDGKSATPRASLQLPERAYCMDIRYPLMVIATAERKLVVVNLTNPQTIYSTTTSPLKYQSRCVSCFPDQQGYCLGSIEGRVAVHHVHDRDSSKNFAFKCHRDNQDIYAVNCITFHPTYGTFATTGSDGTFNFWDKDSRQRLKAFGKSNLPIPVGAFNRDGSIFAYAVSYDWSKGSEHYNPRTNHLLLHPVPEAEIKSRTTARKGFSSSRR